MRRETSSIVAALVFPNGFSSSSKQQRRGTALWVATGPARCLDIQGSLHRCVILRLSRLERGRMGGRAAEKGENAFAFFFPLRRPVASLSAAAAAA